VLTGVSSSTSYADVTINTGTVTVNSAATVSLECRNLTIKDGGVLILNDGTLQVGSLLREPLGLFSQSGGLLKECNSLFFIIPSANGKTVVIPL
jgi:hypothetical protein